MKKAIIAFILVLVLVAAGGVWWTISLSPLSSDTTQKQFVISKGDGVREISKKLKDEGLIRDQITFFLLIKKLNLETKIQAGSYKIAPSQSAEEIAKSLIVGTEDVWVTIPEGWRREEIISYLRTKNINDEVVATGEGKFFPDTYLVPKEITADGFLELMQENFTKKVTFPVTNDQLIIASLVEREARTEIDRIIVASVIYNRLKNDMAIDIDATVQYAIGRTGTVGWWKKDLTIDDLKFKSPYNTYLNPGLPPTPICNPGLSSINAAVNPAQTGYYFYISDLSGKMYYAQTLSEHNQNIAKYLNK
ncbi:MAG: endolytic transglycosylase MltG [bacterium]|nr:endolytic transglycosylase MltG [bacterium]